MGTKENKVILGQQGPGSKHIATDDLRSNSASFKKENEFGHLLVPKMHLKTHRWFWIAATACSNEAKNYT